MAARERSNDDLIVEHLALGHTHARAAELSNVAASTVQRRMKSVAFRKRVAEARREMFASGSAQVTAAMTEAVVTSQALLKDPSSRIKLDAAKAILEYAVQTRKHIDLTQQVEELREELEALKRERAGPPQSSAERAEPDSTHPDEEPRRALPE